MRYKVFYGPGKQTYAVCYGNTEDEARYHFGEYNPNTAITAVEEYPDSTETRSLWDLIDEREAEEVIWHLVDAIEDAGVAHRVAGYLTRHGFGSDDDEDEDYDE